jgi:hypothetical protein
VTSLQQLLDAERAGRDAGWIESFTSHYQRLCEQARAAGFVLHRDLEKGRVPCAHCSSPAWGTLCAAPRDHGRQQACDSRCQPICEADGSTLLSHGVAPWERLRSLSLED